MRIVVLGNEGSWYVADLARAATRRGHECQRAEFGRVVASIGRRELTVPAEFMAGEVDLAQADAVIVRTMPPGSLEQVVFRMDVLHRLEAQGVVIFNPPRSVECAVDKFLTTARLASAGLPVPRTVVCEDSEQALEVFEQLGRDVVVKPLFGAEGRGILRVSDSDLALRAFRTLERLQCVLYVQEFIDHPGYDVRMLVLDGHIVGAMTRHSEHDFRTNLARQAVGQVHQWTPEEERLALAATDVVGARFCGIDLLYDRQGRCHVIEANGVPGWRGFARTTGIDVADRVIEAIERQ